MARVNCPENFKFYTLLCNGGRHPWLWAFPPKGMPADISEEVRSVCDAFGFEGHGHSHLSLRELVNKYLELMISGNEAKELMGYLKTLIDAIPKHVADQDDIRIVFWFDS